MKKALTFALLIVMFAASAFAEEINLGAISLDELIELRNSISEEINERLGYDAQQLTFSDDQIGSGRYTVGKDIQAGRYELICTLSNMKSDSAFDQCVLQIIESDADGAEYLFTYLNITIGQKIFVELKDGNVLVIVRGNFLIQPFSPSWAP